MAQSIRTPGIHGVGNMIVEGAKNLELKKYLQYKRMLPQPMNRGLKGQIQILDNVVSL